MPYFYENANKSTRVAIVTSPLEPLHTLTSLNAALPDNFRAVVDPARRILIVGEDDEEWTMDSVIAVLSSIFVRAEEYRVPHAND